MDLMEIMRTRHSVRRYTGKLIAREKLTAVLQAGLLSASGRAIRPWTLIVVRDKAMLQRMANCRVGAAKMLENADAAVVVIADETLTDVWVEDCAVVMANMHLMADSLGLGSCWIQGRLRETPGGQTTEQALRECLGFPPQYRLEAILSLGMPLDHAQPTPLSGLPMEKIHWEKFGGDGGDAAR